MNETRSVPLTTLAVYLLWAWVAATLAASWSLMLSGTPHIAYLFGATSCVSTGVAIVASMRCYTLRVCQLIRNLHGLGGGPNRRDPASELVGLHGLS